MQVAADYRSGTQGIEERENEKTNTFVRPVRKSEVIVEVRFAVAVFAAAFFLIEVAAKFH